MKKIKIIYQKTIAIIVSISFVFTIIFSNNSFAFSGVSAVNSFIPASLGKVTSANFYNTQELIINIQDLHCHAQTQRNISAILEYLDKQYSIDKIYLEGAYKDINTKWLADFKKGQTGNKILESLVDTGRLSGTEYYSVISNKNEIIAGIEDESLYKENIKLLGEIIDKRDEIEKICSELENDINSIKKEYFNKNKEIKNFENLIAKFKDKKISPKQYYTYLEKLSLSKNIKLDNYPNLKSYINLLTINENINKTKLPAEMKQFLVNLKSVINYRDYINLLNESGNFKNITNISSKLLILDNNHKITDKLKIKNFNLFLQYIELSKNINPVEFMDEEESLVNVLFSKLSNSKYENEVVFLSYFLPRIKNYFLADITAQNYYKFNELFVKFKKIILSYSNKNVVSKLDKYQNLLLQYYKNNIKRDSIFAKKLITKKNSNSNLSIQNTTEALNYIEKNFKGKKVKLVVTGGFHTAGLEKILKSNKISYIIITPKITEGIDKAKEIYADTIKYNANILTNTINIEPLCQESLDISFPKILNDIFFLIHKDESIKNLNEKDILKGVNNFVDENIKNLDTDVKIFDWKITEGSLKDENIKYSVTYLIRKDKKEEVKTIEYVYPSVSSPNGYLSENNFKEAVIFKDLFKSFGQNAELIYKTLLAPVVENFVFLWVPFISVTNIVPYLTAIPFAVTTIFGIFVFPLAHLVADYFNKEADKENESRIFKKFLVPSALFTGIFLSFSLAFPGHSFIAFAVSSAAHSIYNLFVSSGIIKNLPLALIIKDKLLAKTVTEDKIDRIIKKGKYVLVFMESELLKAYPFNKEISRYIIKELYKSGLIDNKNIFSFKARSLFEEYSDIKEYFLSICRYDKKDDDGNELKGSNDILETDLVNAITNLRQVLEQKNNKGNENLKKIKKCVEELEYLEQLSQKGEININEDILPMVRYLINEIIETSSYLLNEQKDEQVIKILNSILPLYKQVILFYGKIEDSSIETIRNIANTFIKQNNINMFDEVFKFITEIYGTNKYIVYINSFNKIDRPIISVILYLLDSLNKNNIGINKYLKDENDVVSINNIVRCYKFDSKEENTELYNFIFDAVINNCDKFDIYSIFQKIYKLDTQNSLSALNLLVGKMYKFVVDDKNSLYNRQIVANDLGKILAFASGKNNIETEYMDITKINELIGNNQLKKISVYVDGLYEERDGADINEYFSFSPLIENLGVNEYKINRNLMYTEVNGKTTETENRKYIVDQFETWKKLIEANEISLKRLSDLSGYVFEIDDDRNLSSEEKYEIQKRFEELCNSINLMIQFFSRIDTYGIDYKDAKESLEKIKYNFLLNLQRNIKTKKDIEDYDLFKIGTWTEGSLDRITRLNALINAVHQISTIRFRENIDKVNVNSGDIQKIYFQKGDIKIDAYNLSDGKSNINGDIFDLFEKLTQNNDTDIKDFIIYNDDLYWTCKLRVHSVSTYFDFKNRSISLSFTESSNVTGNKLRLLYFKKVLTKLGFEVTGGSSSDILTLRANINEAGGINNNTDFVDLVKTVILLFRHSDELDLFLNYIYFSHSDDVNASDKIYAKVKKLQEIFLSGFMWFNYKNKDHETFKRNAPVNLYINESEKERFERLNEKIEQINNELAKFNFETLSKIPEEILNKGLITQKIIDDYINKPLERAVAEGKLIIDKNTKKLVPNAAFNIKKDILNYISKNENDSIKQAELLNFIDDNRFNFNTITNIGGLILKSGYIKLSNDNFLSVNVLTEPNGTDFKYAYTEEVMVSDKRENINYNNLSEILFENNYKIPKKIEDISIGEKENRRNLFNEEIVHFDTPSIIGDGNFTGNGKYIFGEITLNKFETNQNKILAISHTTPEDVDLILNSKAIITTTGSKISHASIVTKEAGIPSVNIADGIWDKDRLYVEDILGQKFVVKEGTKVLLNGETGHILILDDIDVNLLNVLQYYIKKKDLDGLVKLLNKNANNNNLNKLIECMFFQLQNDEIEEVLKKDIDDNVKNKLQNLSDINLKQTEKQIDKTIVNIKNTDNVIVKYILLKSIKQKAENLKNKSGVDTGVLARYEFYKQQVLANGYNFISKNVDIAHFYLEKEKLNIKEIRYILNFIKKIEILNSYLSTEDDYKDIQDKKENLSNLCEQLNNKVLSYTQSYEVTKIQSFNEINEEHFNIYGSKTTELAKISKYINKYENIQVPSGMGISSDVLQFLFDKDTLKVYKQLNENFENAIKNRNIIKAHSVAEDIVNLIDENKHNIFKIQFEDGQKYAVRSSGIGEDGSKNSFAGMGETKLNVSQQQVYLEILECWKSFYSTRAVNYMLRTEQVVKPAILVQKFIEGEKSGVVFSRNKEGNSIISVGYGLGEGIVDDSVPVDNIEINANNGQIINYNAVNKNLQVISKQNEIGTETTVVENELKAKSRALNNKEINELAGVVRNLEKEYGYPIDVEFTIKYGMIYILQVRPITILNDNAIDAQGYQNYINVKAASIFDGLFSNTKTKLYNVWTIFIAPITETVLFLYIPLLIFASDPLGFFVISVIGFVLSHLIADNTINKLNVLNQKRTSTDLLKIGGAGAVFATTFLVVNILLPGSTIVALLTAAGLHSVYNYISIKTGILPAATILSVQDEIEKLKEKKQNGAFATALQRDVFNIFDDLYSQDKQLAKEFIKTVYEERIINLDTFTDIKQLSDDYEKFKCCYDAINSSSEIKRTLSYSIEKVNKILEEDKLNNDEDEINVDLPDISKLSNIVSLISKDETLKLLTIITKINLLNLEKAQRIDNRIIKVFSDIAVLMYDKNDNKYFRKVIELTLNLAANIQDDRNFQNKYEPLLNVIKIIDSMKDVNNLVKNENMDFILEQLSNISAEKYVNMIDDLFGTLGINEIVLKYLFKSLSELNEVNFSLDLPIEKTLLYEENISLITDNVNLLDMRFLCLNLYNKDNVFAKQFTQSVINKLQNNIKIEYKIKDSLIALGQIYSAMYEYMDKDNIMGIDEINELFEQNNIDAKLIKNNVYLSNLYDYDKAIYKFDSNYFYGNKPVTNNKLSKLTLAEYTTLDFEFGFTPLLKNIKKPLFKNMKSVEKSPVFIVKDKKSTNKQFVGLSDNFNAINKILEYNYSALQKLNNINSNSSKKDLLSCVNDVEEMIDSMSLINKTNADMCRKSLKEIKTDIKSDKTKNQKEWKPWNENKLNDISTLHTLINAVHQTSIKDFKESISLAKNYDKSGLQTITAINRGGTVKAYNLSGDSQINSDIYKLLDILSLDRHDVELYVNNSMVVWSCKLLKHSVDVIINLDEKDRGIKIYYSEGHSEKGNRDRILYFSKVLKEFGFEVEVDIENIDKGIDVATYSMEASLNKDSGLTSKTDLAEIGAKIIKLFEYSINLDIKLENFDDMETEDVIDDFVDVFNFGEMDSNYDPRIDTLKQSAPMFMPKPSQNRIKEIVKNMNSILADLGLDSIPNTVLNGEKYNINNSSENKNNELANFFQKDIDKYFNEPIEKAYIQGKIIVNKDGILVENKQYNGLENVLEILNKEKEEIANCAKLLNCLPAEKIDYDTLGKITIQNSDLDVKTGIIKLTTGEYLFIKVLTDNKDVIKYAQAEIVSYDKRTVLTDIRLKNILEKEGYQTGNIKIESKVEKENKVEHIEYPITNEATFDIEEIYNEIGIEQFLKEIELWKQDIDALKTLGIDNGLKAKIAKLADKLYAEQKYSDAADIIYTAYNLGLIKYIDYNWSNIRKSEYDGTVFFYNSIAKHYPENKQLRKALEQTVEILDSSKLNGDFGKEIKTISDNLKNDVLKNNINKKNIYIVYKLFEYYPGKVLSQVRKGALSVEQAMMLFEAILPLYKEIIEQNIEFDDDIFLEFKKAALLVYPVKFDKEYKERKKCFDDFVDFLTDYIAKSKNNGLNYYKYVVEIAANVYRGNSYHSDEVFDENKYKENIQRKQDTIDILTKFQETSSVDYALFANDILKNIVSDETTLALLFKSLKDADWYEYELELNEDALNDEIQNLIVNNCSNLDMGYMCHYFYFENEDGEGSSYFTKSIIEKLINIYNNSGNNELKKSAAVALGEIYSVMYEYIDSNDIISIDELNNFYKQNDMNCFLAKNVSYVSNLYDVDSTAYGTNYSYDSTQRFTDKKISKIRLVDGGKKQLDYDFSITSLILRNDDKNFKIKEKAPIFVKTYKVQSYEDKEQLLDLAGMFDAVKQLLEKNNTTLKEMKNINFENATDKDLNVVVENLEGMIDSMVLISKDDADTCRKSLERIKTDIGRGEIKKQKNLNRWNEDNLSSIDTLHTLINAVHQTGIRDFKTVIRYRNREEDLNWQNLLKSEHKGTEIKAYNLSEKETVNPEIYKMINNLALDKHSVDLVFKDDMVVWSLQLLAHSVDVIVDFGNKDRGIKIYYNEGGDEESNKWRINYFADILNDFGFYVEKDFEGEVYGITASLDNNSGLTDKIDLADMATKIIQLFEYSINLDLKLEGVYTDPTYDYFGDTDHKSRVEGQIKGYADIFMKGEMPFNYNLHVSDIIYVEPFYMDKPSGSRIREFKTYMNSILESLGLEQIPEDILNGKTVYVPNGDEMKNGYGQAGRNFFQKDIDTYFNKPIEQAFIKGQIKLDANGKLSKNKNYNEDFEKMFEEQNEDALIKNAKIIKMIPEYDITYYDTGNSLGSLVARDCAIKLLNGDYLYIKEFVDSTGEIEYAQVELVTDSVRTILTDDKLKKILEYEGYKIENIKVNSNEKENRKNKIKEKIIDTNIPNRLIENTRITSKGNVEYFIADVSFDSDNVSEDTILFKEFTTPKDFSAIKNSGGVVTTAGGTLSHAAITTKELGKPSLIIDNSQWKQDENGKYLEIINYRPVGKKETKNIDGFGVVETQEKEKEIIKIRHGDKVFMSAENGFIVKLSENENLEEQETKIIEYMEILKQQKKSVWRKQIFEKMNVITNVASVSVAEILLFNTWDKIHNTNLPLTDKEKMELKDKVEGIKNNIYTNFEDQYSIDYYKQSEEDGDIDKFVKEKDIVSLDKINANQKNRFGGKTVELAKITKELKEFEDTNVVVPSGLGLSKNVPEEYFGSKFRDLNEKIQELINKNDKDEIEKINIFDAIEDIIENNQNKDLEKYILKNIDKNKFYAVRSSGIGEDGREYAFAGMGESVLNVKGSQIINEIKNVWKSFYDKEAIEYMINTGQFIQPAILVQEMVDAAYAGVAFSRNEKGNLIINVTEGLGDKVVDGTVTPDEIEVNPITGEKINPNIETILTPEQIKELNNIIMFLEGNTGYPIDTEFAFAKDGKLNILQRRADTKFNNIGTEQQADINFDKVKNGEELFYVEYKSKAVPVLVEFDKKYNQITFVVSDDNFNNEDKNNILVRIQDRVNNDIVVRGKVNRHIPIFNNIAQGKLEILPPVPVDNLEIIEDDFANIENSKNTINLLTAA